MSKDMIALDWALQCDSPLIEGSQQPLDSHPGCVDWTIDSSIQEQIVDPSPEGAT